jgi:O-antigen ligase
MLSVGGIVLGLVFGLTRAAWVDMAALAAFWVWARRPPWRRAAALVLLVAFGFLVQTFVIGASPLYPRVLRPVVTGRDHNLAERAAINTKTLESAREGPILGKGAGAGKNVEVKRPNRVPLQRVWNGNMFLFVSHDSGLLGVAALVALLAVVAWAGRRALRRGPDDATRSVLVPLLAAGVALLFAYQFTHALWLMYPYVYLGLLTASMESGAPGC